MKNRTLAAWLAVAPVLSLAGAAPPRAQQEQVEEAASAEERFAELSQEYDTVMKEWSADLRARMKAAQEAGEELPEEAFESPAGEFLPLFQEGADEFAGTDGAVPFLVWIVTVGQRSDMDAARKSLELLADKHHSSEHLDPLLRTLPYMAAAFEGANDSLRKLVERSSLLRVRETAGFALYANILETAPSGTEAFDDALAALVVLFETTENENIRRMAERKVKIAEQFATGMTAPDIEGIDLDGVAFKLSDYKGKVVFLDFWGDW